MRIEGRLVDKPLVNLPDIAVVGLANLERDASLLSPRQVDVTRQMPQDSSHLVITRTDQLPAEHDLRCHLLKHDIIPGTSPHFVDLLCTAIYKDLLPYSMDDRFVQDVVDAVTPEHLGKSFFVGCEDVANQVKPFVDAGIDWVCAFDYLPLVGDPADAPRAVQRLIDLCAPIRQLR